MPEITNPGDGGQGGEGGAPAGGQPANPPETPKQITMTQEDLDRIIADRVARARPKDYDDLVKLRDEQQAAEDEKKTELEKAQKKAQRAEEKAEAAVSQAHGILRRAAIMVEASAQNAADAETVVALLAGAEDITVGDDGVVKGAKSAVKKLLEDKPFLVKAAPKPGASGGEFGGNDSRTVQERISEAESKGDFKESRRLKLAQTIGR